MLGWLSGSPDPDAEQDAPHTATSLMDRAGGLLSGALDLTQRAAVLTADIVVASAVAVADTIEARRQGPGAAVPTAETPASSAAAATPIEGEEGGGGDIEAARPLPVRSAPPPATATAAAGASAAPAAVTKQPSGADPDDAAPPPSWRLERAPSTRKPHPARLTRAPSSHEADGTLAECADRVCGPCAAAGESACLCLSLLLMPPLLAVKVAVSAGPIVLAFLVPTVASTLVRWPFDTAYLYYAVFATGRLGPFAKLTAAALVTPIVVLAPLVTFAALAWWTLALVIGLPVIATFKEDDDAFDGNFLFGCGDIGAQTLESTRSFFKLQNELHARLAKFAHSTEERVEVHPLRMLSSLVMSLVGGALLIPSLLAILAIKTPLCVLRSYWLWLRALVEGLRHADLWLFFWLMAYVVLNALIPVFSALALTVAVCGSVFAALMVPVVCYEKGAAASLSYVVGVIGDVWEFSNVLVCGDNDDETCAGACYEVWKCRGPCGRRTHASEFVGKGASWLVR